MRSIAVVVLLALAGCNAPNTPQSGISGDPPARQLLGNETTALATGGEVTSYELDVLSATAADSLRVLGFQVKTTANLTISEKMDLHGSKRGDKACFGRQTREQAPVPTMQAWLAGNAQTPPKTPQAKWASADIIGLKGKASVNGQDVESPGDSSGFTFETGGSQTLELDAGDWFLLAAGPTGVDEDGFHPTASWTFEVTSSTPFEVVDLGLVGFQCGFGWRDLQNATFATAGVGFVGAQTGGDLALQAALGATFAAFRFDPTMQASGRVVVTLNGEEHILPDELDLAVTAPGPTSLSLAVESWSGYDVSWYAYGLWAGGDV